jgi:hypothetical protein
MRPYSTVSVRTIAADRFLKTLVGMKGFFATYSWCAASAKRPAVQMSSGTSVCHELHGYSMPPRLIEIRNPVVDERKRLIPAQSRSLNFLTKDPSLSSTVRNIAIDIPPIPMKGRLIQKIQRHNVSVANAPPKIYFINNVQNRDGIQPTKQRARDGAN